MNHPHTKHWWAWTRRNDGKRNAEPAVILVHYIPATGLPFGAEFMGSLVTADAHHNDDGSLIRFEWEDQTVVLAEDLIAEINPPLPAWTPFEPAEMPPLDMDKVRDAAQAYGVTVEEAQRTFEQALSDDVVLNSRYQVAIRRMSSGTPGQPDMVHLSIRRRDREPVGTERFRDFQRIKNELVGPECEAMEMYPAESRLADSATQYHLWVIDSPTFRWPWGFNERFVIRESRAGAKQNPFEDGQ